MDNLVGIVIRLCLQTTDLMISEERAPGTTAKHERLHKRSFGLDGVHQIVSGPRMKQLSQNDGAQLRMLYGPFQVVILHLIEQDKAFLAHTGKRLNKLLRSLNSRVCVRLVWIERIEILACQKSAQAHRKVQSFSVQQMLQAAQC